MAFLVRNYTKLKATFRIKGKVFILNVEEYRYHSLNKMSVLKICHNLGSKYFSKIKHFSPTRKCVTLKNLIYKHLYNITQLQQNPDLLDKHQFLLAAKGSSAPSMGSGLNVYTVSTPPLLMLTKKMIRKILKRRRTANR